MQVYPNNPAATLPMSSSRTVTVITSPAVANRSLSSFTMKGSPTAAKQYRIEERKRTIYVTSDVPPEQWAAQDLDNIFHAAEAQSPSSGLTVDDTEERRRRTKSLVETQFLIVEDTSPDTASPAVVASPDSASSSRLSPPQPRRVLVKSGRSPPGSPNRSPIQKPQPRQRILFYDKGDPYYGFTNFSAHPVVYKGKRYPTSEHLFQSFKFHGHRPGLAEHIRTCSERPSVAFSEARRFQPEVRHDWKQLNIQAMEETLWYKFTQHLDLQAELLGTGDAELVEDSDKDAFWGIGADRRGRNELGKALERLRTNLRGGAS